MTRYCFGVWVALCAGVGCLFDAQAAVIRSNGKGGGLWSAPTTWEGGKVPAGDAVAILGKDVVDVDETAGGQILCEELTIDARGALRVTGKNQTVVTFQIQNALKIFGGMIVDFSKDPAGRCEFQWVAGEKNVPEILLNEGCKVLWKGSINSNGTPNVVFRVPAPRLVGFTLGAKTWLECNAVTLEGFSVQITGVDGSGLKFNENCSFRRCHFVRSPVHFQSCAKIEFAGNVVRDLPTIGLYLHSCRQMRIVSNVVERAANIGIRTASTADTELQGNIVRGCSEGGSHVGANDVFINGDRYEGNRVGLMVNSCARITARCCVFAGNTALDIRAVHSRPSVPWRFYDCEFPKPPPKTGAASISVEGTPAVEIINSPLQTHYQSTTSSALVFSAYVDVFVTNEQGEPLGRVPLRVLAGDKVVATSRTEAGGAVTGHTPLPASHRPLVVPWYRFAPQEGTPTPISSMTYQLEVDGTPVGCVKQIVPLVVDEGFVRTDPNKPTKTITVKLAKAK